MLSVDGTAADAAAHDVAIVVIGEKPYAEGHGRHARPADAVGAGSSRRRTMTKRLAPYGELDSSSPQLHPEDLATIRAIRAKGIPVVDGARVGAAAGGEPELARVAGLRGGVAAGVRRAGRRRRPVRRPRLPGHALVRLARSRSERQATPLFPTASGSGREALRRAATGCTDGVGDRPAAAASASRPPGGARVPGAPRGPAPR